MRVRSSSLGKTLIPICAEGGRLPRTNIPTPERRKSSLTFSWLFEIFFFWHNKLFILCFDSHWIKEGEKKSIHPPNAAREKAPLTKHYGICRKEEKKINPSTNKISALFLHLLLLCPYLEQERGSHKVAVSGILYSKIIWMNFHVRNHPWSHRATAQFVLRHPPSFCIWKSTETTGGHGVGSAPVMVSVSQLFQLWLPLCLAEAGGDDFSWFTSECLLVSFQETGRHWKPGQNV